MRLLLLALSIFVITGCGGSGPKTARVSGTVTMSGKPLAKVGVTFLPTKKGPAATGVTNDNGEFTLTTTRKGDGAVLGKHKVTVGIAEEGQKGPAIAEIYASPHTTKLTAEVQSGKTNVFTFDVEPEAPAPPKKGRK
ncbi:MAG TPA: carboxypeptidase-like regulatory domain-containing protein [Pirellulaceae bacterium]|jgi:hypothetical protein